MNSKTATRIWQAAYLVVEISELVESRPLSQMLHSAAQVLEAIASDDDVAIEELVVQLSREVLTRRTSPQRDHEEDRYYIHDEFCRNLDAC